ncbi:TonB-dependent receptor [Belliella marina]|uniref:TonB-dependent receptor n=1 Tax=Belliella marina TaxID=1644146 RepID=A0ABW4VQU2_9BACT
MTNIYHSGELKNKSSFLNAKLIVVLTVLLLFGHSSAKAFDLMSNQITVSIESGTLLELFTEIEAKSEYLVVYNENLISEVNKKQVNLKVKNQDVLEVLKKASIAYGFDYEISGRQIVIKEALENKEKARNITFTQREDRTVNGVIKDEAGEPLPGVSILVKGTTRGTTTDIDGGFSIRVEDTDILVVTYIGFRSMEVAIGNRTNFDLMLQEDLSDLNEFVVTGYGVQEKRAITGAMSSLKGEVIENFPVQSFDRALQGQVSGVNVMANNGVPGGPVSIQIRGVGSITAGSEPLIIVDGVQLNTSTTAGNTASNPLSFLNNNDIESIEVLKDGAAASIYGAQAANGVVLVTTKKGKSGKTQFNINYFTGITEPMPEVAMMNSQQFMDARLTARSNRYPNRTDERNRNDVLSSLGFPTSLTDADIANLPTYNWQREAFQTGKTNNIELNASGGNDKTTFFLSGSHNYTEGNVVGIDFQRSTAKLKLNHQENSRLSFGFDVNLAAITQNGSAGSTGSTGAFAAPQYSSPMMLPWIPIYNEDGSYNAPVDGFPGAMNRNAISETLLGTRQSRTKSIVSNFNVTYKVLDNLIFKSFYGVDFRLIDNETYTDPRTRSGFATQGSLTTQMRQNTNFITNQTLNYNTKFDGGHNLSALLGAEYRSDVREYSSITGQGFTTFQFRTMQSASIITDASASWTGFRRVGVFGQANYDYNKKYLLSAVLRYDGSSRFGTDTKFGWFPAISAGWNLTEEGFLTDKTWLDQLKLRAGYGETGNDAIDNFASRGLYRSASSTNYNQEPGIQPNGIANDLLAWERNVTTNIGVDYAFFNGRISGAVEVFRRLSKDLLLELPLPWTSGYGNVTSNVGELKNEGVEIELRTVNIRKGDFTWSTNFNITFINNEVLRLGDGDMVLPGNQSVRVGYPLRTNFFRQYAGVNSATGSPMFFDANGEITYNPVSPEDLTTFGNGLSSYFGGFTNTFQYKGFSLSVFFQYDYGRELMNSGQMGFWYRNGQDNRNALERIYLDRWTEPGQITTVPRPMDGGTEVNGVSHVIQSSRFLEDASFIRLKQLSMSYDLPSSFVNRMKLRSARIYAQGVNLLTFTEWKGYDPELVIVQGDDNFGSSQGAIPQTRSYTLGIQFGF